MCRKRVQNNPPASTQPRSFLIIRSLLTVLLIVNVLFRRTRRSPTCIRRENGTWWDGFDDTAALQRCCQAGSSTFINGPSKGISSVLAAFINVQVESDPRGRCLGWDIFTAFQLFWVKRPQLHQFRLRVLNLSEIRNFKEPLRLVFVLQGKETKLGSGTYSYQIRNMNFFPPNSPLKLIDIPHCINLFSFLSELKALSFCVTLV